jgi:MFS family permease
MVTKTESKTPAGRRNEGGAPDSAAHTRELTAFEKGALAVLALPTLGLALSITVVSTYVPVVARHFVSSAVVIGLIIGAEGLAAVVLPIVVGTWSDHLRTPLGGRLPFLLAGAPVAALALVGMGLARSLVIIILAVLVFFTAYFIAYEPYRALYPDLLDDEIEGRAQSAQAAGRGIGTGLALAAGGILLAGSQIAPFALAALILLSCTGGFVALLLHRRGVPKQRTHAPESIPKAITQIYQLLKRSPALRSFLMANALWEMALAAIKTFVVLWLTAGLHHSISLASGAIGAVAVLILAAAATSGKIADRYGRERIMRITLLVWGIGMLVPLLTTAPAIIAAASPLIAIGGGVTMALPYAVLIPMMPREEHGALTGLYSVGRGVGIMLGPLLAGVAVQLGSGILQSTHGYAAMWFVAAVAVLGSLPLLNRMRPERS